MGCIVQTFRKPCQSLLTKLKGLSEGGCKQPVVTSASISETDHNHLVSLDVYATVDVVSVSHLIRFGDSAVVALDVNSFAVGFAFDEVTFGDVLNGDDFHFVSFQECMKF
jgi:hypothetical protein